ncbi:IS1 family transposase [Corallococcus sicarius]|uniref:IS1 family transposase n=1 Tax=Corallococcus sicarius TaxID=2316726 RepID=A0A3A8M150_9BACT|nr:IS1 family transposase [Corallococcus sicarius]RKH26063.1 IS1 family transposase [Corallococcus sicarius]
MDRLQELVRLLRLGTPARQVARVLRMGVDVERSYRRVLEAGEALVELDLRGPRGHRHGLDDITTPEQWSAQWGCACCATPQAWPSCSLPGMRHPRASESWDDAVVNLPLWTRSGSFQSAVLHSELHVLEDPLRPISRSLDRDGLQPGQILPGRNSPEAASGNLERVEISSLRKPSQYHSQGRFRWVPSNTEFLNPTFHTPKVFLAHDLVELLTKRAVIWEEAALHLSIESPSQVLAAPCLETKLLASICEFIQIYRSQIV